MIYKHTLMTPAFSPGPNPFGIPPIYCGGFGPKMTEVVGEVADGFIAHPFHTPESIQKITLPALQSGFAKDASLRVRNSYYRASDSYQRDTYIGDTNEWRLFLDIPVKLF